MERAQPGVVDIEGGVILESFAVNLYVLGIDFVILSSSREKYSIFRGRLKICLTDISVHLPRLQYHIYLRFSLLPLLLHLTGVFDHNGVLTFPSFPSSHLGMPVHADACILSIHYSSY